MPLAREQLGGGGGGGGLPIERRGAGGGEDCDYGDYLQDLHERAQRLRQQNVLLQYAYEQELVRTSAAQRRLAQKRKSRGSPWQQQQLQQQRESEERGELAELAQDLRGALMAAVDERQRLEDQCYEVEEAHSQCMADLHAELADARMEMSLLRDRAAQQQAFKLQQAALEEEAEIMAKRRWEEREAAAEEAARLGMLRSEVEVLRSELRSQEIDDSVDAARDAPRAVEGSSRLPWWMGGSTAAASAIVPGQWQARPETLTEPLARGPALTIADREQAFERGAEDIAQRAMRLRLREANLEEEQARVAIAAAQDEATSLAMSAKRVESDELLAQVENLMAEEQVLESKAQPLRHEAEALSQHYEQQKRLLVAYGVTLQRPWRQVAPEVLSSTQTAASLASRDRRPGGLPALVKELAWRCGSPEVAFYRLDLRGTGRLDAEDLGLGLLLGTCIDCWSITGLSGREVFTALDRRGAGAITVVDLAACCPDEWRQFGAPLGTPAELLRVAPWTALGGPAAAYDEAVKASGKMTQNALEDLLCNKMAFFSKEEVPGVLRGLHGSVSREAWCAATAEP